MGTMPHWAMEDERLVCMACKPVKSGDSMVMRKGGTVGSRKDLARETKSQMCCDYPY